MRMRVELVTLLGQEHLTALVMRDINEKTNLEEYNLPVREFKACHPSLITQWVQIQFSEWFAWKLERGRKKPFPDLMELWRKMDLQKTRGPTPLHTPWLQGRGEGVRKDWQTEW